MSLRVTDKIDYDFGLTYSLTVLPSSKSLTQLGAIILSILPIAYFIVTHVLKYDLQPFLGNKIEIALFVIGASLLLPNIQPDQSIRRKLMLYYLVPIIFGLVMVFI